MSKNMLLCLSLTIISISLAICSKMNSEKTNVMTTTEATSIMDSMIVSKAMMDNSKAMTDNSKGMTNNSKAMTDNSKAMMDNSKAMMDSKTTTNTHTKDDIDLIALMTMCNESFRIEMSYLIVLNESGSFPDETDKTPKCYLRCLLENLNIESLEDGKIDAERAAVIFAGEKNEASMHDIQEIATYCAQRNEACRCEIAYNFLKCLFSMEIEKYNTKSN